MKPFHPSLADHRTKPRNCPYCGKTQDGAMSFSEGTNPPKPGDLLICIYCGNWGIVADDMEWRMPTAEERKLPATHADLAMAIQIARQVAAKRKEQHE